MLDNEDRIIEVADGSTATAYYTYDRSGRRTSKTVGEVKTYFAYDKYGNIIAEYIRDGNETVWWQGKIRVVLEGNYAGNENYYKCG